MQRNGAVRRTRSRLSRQQREARSDEMIAKGVKLADEDIDVIADYLGQHVGRPAE